VIQENDVIMMGDRDFRTTIQNAIKSIGNELEIDIDSKDFETNPSSRSR